MTDNPVTEDAFHAAMRAASVSALWERPARPNTPAETAHVWRWETIEPLIDAAVGETNMDNAERRVLVLHNPALNAMGRMGASKSLSVNLQVLMPGERARPHRHTMSALRFVLEGSGAVTVVDGKPCEMARGDMILTPGWTWHEHVHEGDTRMVWVDALDVPVHDFLDTGVFEPGPAYDVPDLPSDEAFSAPGLTPESDFGGIGYSPMFRYPWQATVDALAAMPSNKDGSRVLRYTNPATGGAAMTTIDCHVVGLAKGQATRPYRTNSSAVCVVVDGEGTTEVDGTTLTWRENDVFALPHDSWISHTAARKDTRLFQVSDRELFNRMGILREEFRD
jgi:gentisate 1,2-dioxygenase